MKSHNIQSDMSTIKSAFIMSLGFFVLFNTSILLYKYSYYKSGAEKAFIELFKESLYILVMLTISFIGFSINNMLFRIYSIFLYASGALTSYFVYTMKILPTKQIVKAFFDVESVEAYELVSIKMVAWLILSIIACIYLLKKFEAKQNSNKASIAIMFIFFILSIANIITPFYRVFTTYLPINYLHNSYHYFLDTFSNAEKIDITKGNNFSNLDDENMLAILVIGESARSDHFSLAGYNRETNPLLSKKKA